MKRATFLAVMGIGAILPVFGCSQVSESWEDTSYFERHRSQTVDLQKRPRDRLSHTQGEYARPAHQVEQGRLADVAVHHWG